MRPFQLDWLWPFIKIFYSLKLHQKRNVAAARSINQGIPFHLFCFAFNLIASFTIMTRIQHSVIKLQWSCLKLTIFYPFNNRWEEKKNSSIIFTRETDLHRFFLVWFGKKMKKFFCFVVKSLLDLRSTHYMLSEIINNSQRNAKLGSNNVVYHTADTSSARIRLNRTVVFWAARSRYFSSMHCINGSLCLAVLCLALRSFILRRSFIVRLFARSFVRSRCACAFVCVFVWCAKHIESVYFFVFTIPLKWRPFLVVCVCCVCMWMYVDVCTICLRIACVFSGRNGKYFSSSYSNMKAHWTNVCARLWSDGLSREAHKLHRSLN